MSPCMDLQRSCLEYDHFPLIFRDKTAPRIFFYITEHYVISRTFSPDNEFRETFTSTGMILRI